MRRAAWAAALGVAAVAAVVPPVVVPAAGQEPESPADDRQLLTLLDRTPWVGDGLDFTLQLRVEGAPADAVLQVSVHDRVTSRSAFARSLEGEGLRRRLAGPEPTPLTTADPDGDGIVQRTVALAARTDGTPVVNLRTPGVYPVVVELVDGDDPDGDTVLDVLRTHLVRLPAADPDPDPSDDGDDENGESSDDALPLGVAVVVPFGAPPAHLDPEGPAPSDLPVAALAGTLADHPDVPVNLAPVPESIAAAAETDAPAVRALASALAASQVLRAPWVELDEAAWARADDAELAAQLERGDATLRRLLSAEPDATRLAPPGVLTQAVDAMVDHGARALVVDEDDLSTLDDDDFPYTLGRPFRLALDDDDEDDDNDDDGPTVPALASDRALVALAAEAELDPILAAHHVLADLAVLAQDEPESVRVATLVLPEAAVSPVFLDELLDGLQPPVAPPPPTAPPIDPSQPPPTGPGADPNAPPPTAPAPIPAADPIVRGITIAEALDVVEPAGADGGADADDPLVRRLTTEGSVPSATDLADAVAERRADVGSYRGVFGPGDDTGEALDAVLASVVSSELGARARADALAEIDTRIDTELGDLQGPADQRVTLTAREGRVQLLLTNDTGRPADAVLLIRGDRLVFPDAESGRVDVHLAQPTTRLELRVETRASGDAPLDIQLTTPDERLDLGQSRIVVRASAVSGVGIVLMGAAAAFLAAWWSRTILRDRRQRRRPAHARPEAPEGTA